MTSHSPEWTLYQVSYQGRNTQNVFSFKFVGSRKQSKAGMLFGFNKISVIWNQQKDSATFIPKYSISCLKEKDQKQLNITKMEVFLKTNCLVQISYKSNYKQESYWRLKI